MSAVVRLNGLLLIALVAAQCAGTGRAGEITTNGSGGGRWSDPGTWRGKKVPAASDDAVIQKGDLVTFDRNDDGKVTCQKLLIDPKGSLIFKTGAGKIVCCLGDVVETYGIIKLDGTRSATDSLELRLVGAEAAKRTFKVLKGGGLLAYGRKNLPRNARNVALTSPEVEGKDGKKADVIAIVEASTGAMLDVQRARVISIHLTANTIDNTGAKANERINVIDNHFTGPAQVYCYSCDTPVVSGNTFQYTGPLVLQHGAITFPYSTLAEARGNTVQGTYLYGLYAVGTVDVALTDNTVEKCTNGAFLNSCNTSMLKDCTFRNCETGVVFHQCSGSAAEGLVVEGAKTSLRSYNGNVQWTSCRIDKPVKGGDIYSFEHPANGGVSLSNCNILASQVKVVSMPPKPVEPLVVAMHYLIVGVDGAPAEAHVEARTTNPMPALAKGAADPNVRNTPATITRGLTPLPQTLKPLMVRAWSIEAAGKIVPAPDYTVTVFLPPAKEGAPPQVLKTLSVKPLDSWFRAKPNDAVPTVKVPLK